MDEEKANMLIDFDSSLNRAMGNRPFKHTEVHGKRIVVKEQEIEKDIDDTGFDPHVIPFNGNRQGKI